MAVSNKNLIDSMIQGIQKKDPKLYDILRLMSDDLGALLDDIRPLIAASSVQGEDIIPPPAPINFFVTTSLIGVNLTWDIDPASEGDVALYEVRKGVDWSTAERVTKTAAFNVFLNPLPAGYHTYLIKSINRTGVESLTYASGGITILQPQNVMLAATCIDNNVLLSWAALDSTFRIDHFVVSRDGSFYGNASSTFISIFESSAATFRYGVKAVDIAGNVGNESFIDVEVKQPPDYSLIAENLSTFNGTKSNCIVENGQLWAIIETAKTWETHFSTRGFTNINDQLNAGFDHYLEPGATSGYYEEVVDFGAIFNNIIINLDWDFYMLSGNVTVAGQIEISTDNINWGAPIAGVSAFATACRYARVRLIFTGSGSDDLIIISQFRVLLDVKQETDSGNASADKADSGGTVVYFNKSFKDVNSITLTTNSIQPIYAVYDFQDVPNPTSFKILVFDSAGNRISYPVSWKARGVV